MLSHVDHQCASYGWQAYNLAVYNPAESGRLARLILCFR